MSAACFAYWKSPMLNSFACGVRVQEIIFIVWNQLQSFAVDSKFPMPKLVNQSC